MFRRSTAFVLAALATAVALPVLAAKKDDEAAIRAARAASNAGIAAHDAQAATASFDPAARVQGSGGGLVPDKATMIRAFESAFADPKFVKFVRTPDRIDIGGDVAAETGRWVGEWKTKTVSGSYLVRWNRIGGEWRIVGELYVPLGCKGPDCGA